MTPDGAEGALRRDRRASEAAAQQPPADAEATAVAGNDEASLREPPVEPTSASAVNYDDVEHPVASARIPGDPRRPMTSFPTDEIAILPTFESGPRLGDTAFEGYTPLVLRSILAPWALVLAIIALLASFFVGWGIPVAVLAVGFAVAALRRPIESRALALWALVLGLLATVFSLGWLIWAARVLEQGNV